MKKMIISNLFLTLLAPTLVFAQVGIAPLTKDQQYSVIVITPDIRGYPALEKVGDQLTAKLKALSNDVMKTASKGLLQPKGLNADFKNLGESYRQELGALVKSINKDLPNEEGVVYSMYVTPYTVIEKADKMDLPIVGGVQMIQQNNGQMEAARKNSSKPLYRIMGNQIDELPQNRTEKFQFVAAAAHIRLIKNNVEIQLQLLGNLKSGSEEFLKINDQVSISHLEILSDPVNKRYPMALMNVTVGIPTSDKFKPEPPHILIDFGGFGRITGGYGGRFNGAFQIYDDPVNPENTCLAKLNTVPSLFGVFASKPTGNFIIDKILKDEYVRFRIMHMTVDTTSEKLPIKLEVLTALEKYKEIEKLTCIKKDEVNDQFSKEASDSAKALVSDLMEQKDATPELMQSLYE